MSLCVYPRGPISVRMQQALLLLVSADQVGPRAHLCANVNPSVLYRLEPSCMRMRMLATAHSFAHDAMK